MDLDHLFCLLAWYTVKHNLPLTLSNTEDKIACGDEGFKVTQARVATFWATWGDSCPYHHTISKLPPNMRFTTAVEVEDHHIKNATAIEAAKMYSNMVTFTLDLARNLYENNFTSHPLVEVEVDVVVITNSL
ncbi:hypothetical protein BJY52DRAFT_1192477 [Lactarius psammicola]|nr:hypothetical protein BJY52DRAFT_1192477 [Lactarius psammicola]